MVRTLLAAPRTPAILWARCLATAAFIGIGFGAVSNSAIAHGEVHGPERLQVHSHNVLSELLPHLPGQRITFRVVEIPPGGASPCHRHAGAVAVFVLSGAIRSQLQGQIPAVYRAGESFFEPPGAVHQLSENASTSEAARILAVFVADDGAMLTTYSQ